MNLADHLWQSTAFAAVAGLLTLALRSNSARLRHWLWFAASVKFLIPLSLLIDLGSRIEWKSQPVRSTVTIAVDQIVEPFTMQSAPLPPPVESPLPSVLLAIWALGAAGISSSWLIRWRRMRRMVGSGVMVSDTDLEPGVFGIFRPVLVLPKGIAERLTPAQLEAVIAHEMCHIRHHDNLLAAIHMFVETIFWFHPLVWWIGKRMLDERERACDEEVLRDLCDPQSYAEGILSVCKLYVESPLACVSGITGADLKKRIEAIMKNRGAFKLTTSRKLILAAAALAVIAVPMGVGVLRAQGNSALRNPGNQAFEVAMLRMEDPNSKVDYNRPDAPNQNQAYPTNRISEYHVLLKSLISAAYGFPYKNILGGPAWLDSQHYDLSAKVEGDARLTKEQMRPMLQNLLKDRLKLAVHSERRIVAGYQLVIAKGGSKLKANTGAPFVGMYSGDEFKSQNGLLAPLRSVIESLLKQPVVDNTGLLGNYDFDLKFAPNDVPDSRHAAYGNIFTALQDQLGLKLEPQKVSVDYLVIDKLEKIPTDN